MMFNLLKFQLNLLQEAKFLILKKKMIKLYLLIHHNFNKSKNLLSQKLQINIFVVFAAFSNLIELNIVINVKLAYINLTIIGKLFIFFI